MSNTAPSESRIQTGWRLAPLLALHACAAVLLMSWLWPLSQMVWAQLDTQGFILLNDTLRPEGLWRDFWAIASVRAFDLVAAAIMLLLLTRKDWLFRQIELRQALFTFLALLIILLVIRVLFAKLTRAMGWQHSSPSLQIAESFRLSEYYPYLAEHFDLKDASKRSFPGDHASVVLLWGMFLALFARGGKLALVLSLTTLLMMPRLIAGAHWISDDLVGGLFLTLLAFAWGYYSPLGGLLANGLARLGNPVMNHLGRWPLLKQFALFQPPA